MIKEEIDRHKIAAKSLCLIVDKAFKFIRKNIGKVSEYDVHKFILSEFKKQNCTKDRKDPIQIIAVNKNTANKHYFPPERKSKIIRKNNLVMVDIWARLKNKNSPFADITWMGYSGKNIPRNIKEIFKIVIGARNAALKFIRKELKKKRFPKTKEIDKTARDYFKKFNLERFFIHNTGHSLGVVNCHGKSFNLSKTSRKKLKPNIPFTIEPGLYFKNKFGIRSEIDCYVTRDYKLIITTKVQKEIIKI